LTRTKQGGDGERPLDNTVKAAVLRAAAECRTLAEARSRVWVETGVFVEKQRLREIIQEAAGAAPVPPLARWQPGKTPLARGIPERRV
jgi:hypothetical protein